MGHCNRCDKDNVEVTGTPQYKVCKGCFGDLQEQDESQKE